MADTTLTTSRTRPRRRSETRVAQLRLEQGIVQGELADLLDISVPRYSGIENATLDVPWRWPTVEQAQVLAEHFGKHVSDLWPFLMIGPCASRKHRCSELTFIGRECRKRLVAADILCDGCGEPLSYRRPARIGVRNRHRRCYVQSRRGRQRPLALLRAMWVGYCEWRLRETGTTSTYGRYAKLLAESAGKRVGPRPRLSPSEEIEIRQAQDPTPETAVVTAIRN